MPPSLSMEFSGDEQKLLRSYSALELKNQKLVEELRKVKSASGKAGEGLKRAGETGAQAFGQGAIKGITNYALKIASITVATREAIEALKALRAIERESTSRIQTEEQGRRALAQIVTSEAEYKSLLQTSQGLRTRFGMDPVTAHQVTFGAASAGLLKDVSLFAGLPRIAFDPEADIEAAQKLQATFGGVAGAGDARAIINKALAAAGPAPLMASKFARSAAVAAAEFASIGGEDEELFALLGVLAKPFKTPETAGERIKAAANALAKAEAAVDPRKMRLAKALGAVPEDFEFRGLQGLMALPELARQDVFRGPDGKRLGLREVLGSQEAVAAVTQMVALRAEIESQVQAINEAQRQSGGPQDKLATQLAIVGADPQLATLEATRRSQQARDLGREREFGTMSALAEEIIESRLESRRQQQRDTLDPVTAALDLQFARRALQADRYIRGDEEFVRRQLGQLGNSESEMALFRAAIQELMGGLGEAVHDMRGAARELRGGPTLKQPDDGPE